jgi:Uma2 family endonuclease
VDRLLLTNRRTGMSANKPLILQKLEFERAAEAYLHSLPLEHHMEATLQATQRKITLESLDFVHASRPQIQVFNELLVQYRRGREGRIQQVVPDNMVVVCDQPIKAVGSFNLPFQPEGPYWVLEYVSRSNERKDYEDSFEKYERDLKIPYYLVFRPEDQELILFRHGGRKYTSVKPNGQGRYPIPELEMEIGLLDGWVRFWFHGELVPLPADFQRELDEMRQRLARTMRQARREKRRADEMERRAEELARRADEERQARLAAEEELARLRAQLEQQRNRPNHRT